MIHAIVRTNVEEFERFWSGFQTRGLPLRQEHGSRGAQVFRNAEDSTQVTILFEWESRDHMERFFQDPRVKDSIQKGGASAPEVTFLEKAGQLAA